VYVAVDNVEWGSVAPRDLNSKEIVVTGEGQASHAPGEAVANSKPKTALRSAHAGLKGEIAAITCERREMSSGITKEFGLLEGDEIQTEGAES